MAIEWLDSEPSPMQADELLYPLDKALAKYRVRELVAGWGWLVLKMPEDPESTWMHFAVLQFVCSDGDDKNVLTQVVFHGEGPSGNLRECRHTYWGDEGYIFYPNGKVIMAAFRALAEFYDEME